MGGNRKLGFRRGATHFRTHADTAYSIWVNYVGRGFDTDKSAISELRKLGKSKGFKVVFNKENAMYYISPILCYLQNLP
jgi:hypothetical protein